MINVSRGGFISLHEVAAYDISGGYDSASWIYRVDLPGPSGITNEGHPVRFNPSFSLMERDPSALGLGVSPGAVSGATATRLLSALETLG